MKATKQEVDFRNTPDRFQYPSGVAGTENDRTEPSRYHEGNLNAPRTAEGKLLTAKQIRARARRKAKRAEIMARDELFAYHKPIEEWDLEELAKGRPRDSRGGFRGAAPKWITRDVHEKAMERFRSLVKSGMNTHTVTALDAIDYVLRNEEVDEKGKPLVSASTKLDAAKFLLEHTVGKPTQRVESDISVKLQGILGQVLVNPAEALMPESDGGQGYSVGHLPGVTMPMAEAIDAEVVDDDSDLDENYG